MAALAALPPLHDVQAVLRQHHQQALQRLERWIACEEQLAQALMRQAAQAAAPQPPHSPRDESMELVPPSRPVALLKGGAASQEAPADSRAWAEGGEEVGPGFGEAEFGPASGSRPREEGNARCYDVEGELGADPVVELSGAAETPAQAEEVPNERHAGIMDSDHDELDRITASFLNSQEDEFPTYAINVFRSEDAKKPVADLEPQHGAKGSTIVRIVESPHFEAVSGFAVALYMLLIGIEVEILAQQGPDAIPAWLHVVDYSCTAWFVVELMLRFLAHGRHIFRSRQRGWILFDAVLVLSSFVDTGFVMFTDSDTASSLSTARILRIVRITRLIRVMRVVRVVRFVRALRVMLYSIMSTLKSLVWAVVLLFMVIYFFAVIFTHAILIQPPLSQVAAQTDEEFCSSAVSSGLKYWGTLGTSMLTLLESLIGGVDWKDPLAPLADIHWVWLATFIVFILFTYFAILNVITAAFCQGALEGQQYDRDQTVKDLVSNKKSHLYKTTDLFANMFSSMDLDGSGKITWDEFSSHVADDSVQALLALLDLNDSDLWILFQLLDGKKSAGIDAKEFVSGCMRLKGPARSIDLAQVARNQKKLTQRLLHFMRLVSREMVDLRKTSMSASKSSDNADFVLPQNIE